MDSQVTEFKQLIVLNQDDLKENPKYKTIYGWFLNKVQKSMFIRFVEKVEKLRHDKSIKMS